MRRGPGAAGAVGIVGLGLLGGSLAKAVAARFPRKSLIGVDPSARTRRLAAKDGIFDLLSSEPSPALARCEIVVLCAPVPAILRLLGPVSRWMREGAVLTDVAGVKEPIVAAARRSVRRGVLFAGAHPMFGGEKGGYQRARPALWKGGVVAVCTNGAGARALGAVARLHRALGARVVLCRAAEHDAAVAAVSHLLYLVASALALTAAEAGPLARRLAAKGLLDTTRLARFAYGIQGEVARSNAHLPRAARNFERTLRSLQRALFASPGRARKAFRRAQGAKKKVSPN